MFNYKYNKMISKLLCFLILNLWSFNVFSILQSPQRQISKSDLIFDKLALSWDEGIPLGNATIGMLVWQRDSTLRFSLDRTDLWDLRPTDSLSGYNYRFDWVKDKIKSKDYLPVQKKFDWPYDREPAPSKIPGAALEFSLKDLGSPFQC